MLDFQTLKELKLEIFWNTIFASLDQLGKRQVSIKMICAQLEDLDKAINLNIFNCCNAELISTFRMLAYNYDAFKREFIICSHIKDLFELSKFMSNLLTNPQMVTKVFTKGAPAPFFFIALEQNIRGELGKKLLTDLIDSIKASLES